MQRLFNSIVRLRLRLRRLGDSDADLAKKVAILRSIEGRLARHFVDRSTRVEPTPLRCHHGKHWGLIELRDLAAVNACVAHLRPALDPEVVAGYLAWVEAFTRGNHAAYFEPEMASANNHAIAAVLLLGSCALVRNDHASARPLLDRFHEMLRVQVAADGSLPKETCRPTSLHYALFFLELAATCTCVFACAFGHEDPVVRKCEARVRHALDFVCRNVNAWPYRNAAPTADRPWTHDAHRLLTVCRIMGHPVPTIEQPRRAYPPTHHTGMLPAIGRSDDSSC